MSTEGFDCVIPSSEADRKKLKMMIEEAVNCMVRVEGENEHKKEIINGIKEQFKIDRSIITDIIRMRYKRNFSAVNAKKEATNEVYETLFAANEKLNEGEDSQ